MKLVTKYPSPDATNTSPAAPCGSRKVSRTDGQATPMTASGRPRLMKPTYARRIRSLVRELALLCIAASAVRFLRIGARQTPPPDTPHVPCQVGCWPPYLMGREIVGLAERAASRA